VFVLVLATDKPDEFDVVGWIRARDAKGHPEWRKDPGNYGLPAFFVPQSALTAFGEKPKAAQKSKDGFDAARAKAREEGRLAGV
jgi:hypothetical protein